MRLLRSRYVLIGAFLLILSIFLPRFVSSHTLHITIMTLWFIYLCSAWNVVGGFAGQFCFAHPIFLAAGGYTSTLMFLNMDISPWIGMFPGSIIATLFGILMAWIAFRYKLPHLSFALITLGLVFICEFVLGAMESTGGHDGLAIVIRDHRPFYYLFDNKTPYYFVMLIMTVGVVTASIFIERSKFGLWLRALRDNEQAAQAGGINVLAMMTISMGFSAFLTSLAGTFFAQYMHFIDPEGIAGPRIVIQMILFTAIGGMGTVWGPVIGPLLLYPFIEGLNVLLGSSLIGVAQIIYGIILVIVILNAPEGLVGWFQTKLRLKISSVETKLGNNVPT